mgnify:FL=1
MGIFASMKNVVIVDIDTEREDQIILIGKPEEFKQPETKEEAFKMLDDDILSLSEALVSLITVGNDSGHKSKDDLYNQCINHIKDGINK